MGSFFSMKLFQLLVCDEKDNVPWTHPHLGDSRKKEIMN